MSCSTAWTQENTCSPDPTYCCRKYVQRRSNRGRNMSHSRQCRAYSSPPVTRARSYRSTFKPCVIPLPYACPLYPKEICPAKLQQQQKMHRPKQLSTSVRYRKCLTRYTGPVVVPPVFYNVLHPTCLYPNVESPSPEQSSMFTGRRECR